MNTTIATSVLCFGVLYLLEGIDNAINKKSNFAYKATHVVYPFLIVLAMLYFLATGVIE